MNPILLNLPETIETRRLMLRAPLYGDGPLVNEAIRESFASLHEWLRWADHVPDVEETEGNVRQQRIAFLQRARFTFHMMEKETDRFLGACTLKDIEWDIPRCEIGYWLRDSAGGRGYMTEAVNGVTDFADRYLGVNRIRILCDARNIASRGVAERSGYHLEAILKHNYRDPHGQIADDCVYAKIRMADGRMGYPTI
jgi:ribosomal-protein-serine acetyltransferase